MVPLFLIFVNSKLGSPVDVLRFCHHVTVLGKCHHEGDGDIEQERAEEVSGIKPGG